MKEKLIIFVKNAREGHVKTRLARDIGNENALSVYKSLLAYTHQVTKRLDVKKEVCFSKAIEEHSIWDNSFNKTIQQGADLGERMRNAFSGAFQEGNEKVILIGSDCAELTQSILEEAFASLNEYDVVIGPAEDRGYYLIGMNSYQPTLFAGIPWSTGTVLEQTISGIKEQELTWYELPKLNDVDDLRDWQRVRNRIEEA